MFTFIIPLRPSNSTTNWPLICGLFENTLRSIFQQTEPDFKVLVVCHERPELQGNYDDRLEYLEVDLPRPSDSNGVTPMDDKWVKLAAGLMHLSDSPPDYTMFVDADDLVSRRLVAHVLKDRDPNGYIIKNGYFYQSGKNWLRHIPTSFNCGTNSVLNTSQYEFPISLSGPDRAKCLALRSGHMKIETNMRERGTPLTPLPFPGAIYVLHGEQDSDQVQHGAPASFSRRSLRNRLGATKSFLRVAHQYRRYSNTIREEFGVTPDDYRPLL